MVGGFLRALVAFVLVAVLVALAIIFTGAYNVAATEPHTLPVRWALDTTFKNSVQLRARGIAVPAGLDDAQTIERGARNYAAMCVTCHGAVGRPLPEMAQHMRPHPPHLSDAAREWQANEIFWIVKHGVKMTGMPAWGPTHSEDDLWATVAFVQRLPGMSQQEYQRLVGVKPQPTGQDQDPGKGQAGQNGASQKQAQAGGQAGAQGGEQAAGAAPGAKVEMTASLKYQPATVTIRAGETVEWVNPSQVAHTVTADKSKASDPQHVQLPEGADPFDSGVIEPGGRYTHRFTVPGRYRYFCIPHEAAGMVGEVVVRP